MRPCDCTDNHTADQLDHQGFSFNDKSIEVKPPVVVLKVGACTVRIPMGTFKRFATWYLEDQSC